MSSTPSDVSLYELAVAADPSTPVLHISPATFKSLLESVIELLIEQQIPAVVLAKLPRGEVWSAELERYTLLNTVSKAVYTLKNHREETTDDVSMVNLAMATSRDDAMPEASSAAETSFFSIQLAPNSLLRREYFLIVWSAQLQGAIVAQRSRTPIARSAAVGNSAELDSTAGETVPEEGDRKQQLLLLHSFDAALVERLLEAVERAIEVAEEQYPAAVSTMAPTSADATSPSPLWKERMADMVAAPINLKLMEHLVAKQLLKQEDIWQRGTTYRKQAEVAEILQLQNEELTNTVRLKDDFLSNVGQELRTPLTTIKTALSLLNSPTLKPPQRQRYLDLIAKECDRQSSLITSLLDLVQLDQMAEQAVLQPLRLADVVPGVVSTYQPLAGEKGIQLAYTVPEDLPPVSCANNWLKQIVINLLNNAIKFTPPGGQVWVRAKQQGEYVQLEFRDTGIGIPPGEIPKIFDRFYRVRQGSDEYSGAGLGLTIVQQLLLHMGGSISVKSRPEEGSVFNVLMPIHKLPIE